MKRGLLAILFVCLASLADAQVRLGVRAAATADPGIAWGGVQLQSSTWHRLRFRQSLDLGMGSRTALGSDTEILLNLFRAGPRWRPYVGAGMSAIIASSGGSSTTDAYTGGGPVVIVGLQRENGLFIDTHIAVSGYGYRSAAVRLSVGYVIPRLSKPK